MNIGFDAKRAFLNNTGLGNYSRLLISGLQHYYPKHHYFLYSPTLPQNNRTQNLFQLPAVHLRKAPWYLPGSIWRSRFIAAEAQKDQLSIYHGLSNELPLRLYGKAIKQVVTIHDLIFLRYPNLYPATDRRIYEAKVRHACRQADKIIAISEQTKRDLINFLTIPEEKIIVFYQGCSEIFKQRSSATEKLALQQKYKLPSSYLLQVGTIETRKNLLLSLQALTLLPEEIKLVAVGKTTSYLQEIEAYLVQNRLENRVYLLSDVSFTELPALYQGAEAFLYPSRFEGFGIPILEALNSKIPVIAATGSCLEEAGGPHSLYVSPDQPRQLAHAIHEVLNQPQQKEKMVEKGLEYAQQFEPEPLTNQLMELYASL